MDPISLVVIAVVVVWYAGSLVDTAAKSGERMANNALSVAEARSKAKAIESLSKLNVNDELVTQAKSNKAALQSIEL